MKYIFSILFTILCATASASNINSIWAPVQVVTAGDMSQATITSTAMNLRDYSQFAFQAVWTGSPVGTLELDTSNDNVPCTSAVNWSQNTSSVVAVTAAGNFLWNASFANYHCVRLVYTKTSGTGTLNVVYSSK